MSWFREIIGSACVGMVTYQLLTGFGLVAMFALVAAVVAFAVMIVTA